MKSVSFSDLRNSSDMINRLDTATNSLESNIKRSSSYKNLTYYSSSEDILKRFSSKTSELRNSKDGYRSDETHNEVSSNQQEKPLLEKQREKTVIEKPREKYPDVKVSASESTIQELKAVISDQEKTISDLQEKNLLLQSESYKNSEEIKFQENRIKYLEHMLAAFNTNIQDNKKSSAITANDEHLYNGLGNSPTMPAYSGTRNRVNFEKDYSTESSKCSNVTYTREMVNSFTDTSSDLKIRPSSADSSLNNVYKYTETQSDKEKRNQFLPPPMKTYTSDTEERMDIYNKYDPGYDNQKLTQTDYIARQRQQLDRDRTVNLSDFKSRLDEFTKYAKRSAEQNSLHQFTGPSGHDGKGSKKYGGLSDNSVDQQYKMRSKGQLSQATDSRPPIDPYYKQRRALSTEVKPSFDRAIPNYKVQEVATDDDESLKERVQKILERHNYPATATRSDNPRKVSEYSHKTPGDYYNSVPTNLINSRGYERNSTDSRYGYHSTDYESNVPRLDLSLYSSNSDTTNDLITKYLNYQGSTNVS